MNEATIIALGIAFTGGVVRALKTDTISQYVTLPKRALPWLSLFVGLLFVLLVEKQSGKTWEEAIMLALVQGTLVGGGAAYVHDLGKAVPGVGKALAVLVVVGVSVTACLPVKDPSAAKERGLTVIQLACIAANAFLPDQAVVMKACKIADTFAPTVADLILAQKKAGAVREGKLGADGSAQPVCIQGDELVACTP